MFHEEQTPYKGIEVNATEGLGNLMCSNACTLLSMRENVLYHEMMSHPALLAQAAPQSLSAISGQTGRASCS